ncbi:hypothetical protein [Streptomyces anulatus]|uniref:hypothetical protein n=1 Tax=Streptomyces anulatus TaxID=1892 RepID=UPI003439782A
MRSDVAVSAVSSKVRVGSLFRVAGGFALAVASAQVQVPPAAAVMEPSTWEAAGPAAPAAVETPATAATNTRESLRFVEKRLGEL